MSAEEPTAEALAEERARLRQLRAIVDFTTSVLRQGRLERREALALVAAARSRILALFPEKAGAYDIILAPRFARLIEEFAAATASSAPR
jgi:hypothetical protein